MRPIRFAVWAAALAALALPAADLRAVEEPPRPPASALTKIRDLVATVRVRRALEEDRSLAALNLGVWVENGVVSVWGPVPSSEVGRQAVALLQAVKGVSEVRPNFYQAQPGGNHRLDDLLVRPPGVPERIAAAKPEIETGELPPPVRPREIAVPVGREQPSVEGPRLFAPRAVAASTAPVRPEAAADSERLPRPVVSLADQVRETQRSERRFHGISVRLENRAVIVRRGDFPGRDVMDLVRKLQRIEGVTDVILADD